MNQAPPVSLQSLIGSWSLLRTESTDAGGQVLDPPYGGEMAMGLVSFSAENRMVAVLCDSRANAPTNFKREFVSYCGSFSFDGRRLVTHVDASSRADWFGTSQVRDVALEGETLVLRPPQRAYAGQPEQRVLYWKKLNL